MVGHAHGDRVDLLLHRIEHLAVVLEPLRLRVLLEGVPHLAIVDVAEGDDVVARAGVDARAAPAADADAGDVELVARREAAGPTEQVRRADLEVRPARAGALLEHNAS